MIRYFASVDDSVIYGKIALAYCDAMARMGIPMRVLASQVANLQLTSSGKETSRWGRHRDLFLTPMQQPYVNVVCCEPMLWERFWTPKTVQLKRGAVKTHCVRNVLILSTLGSQADVVKKYEVVLHRKQLIEYQDMGRVPMDKREVDAWEKKRYEIDAKLASAVRI